MINKGDNHVIYESTHERDLYMSLKKALTAFQSSDADKTYDEIFTRYLNDGEDTLAMFVDLCSGIVRDWADNDEKRELVDAYEKKFKDDLARSHEFGTSIVALVIRSAYWELMTARYEQERGKGTTSEGTSAKGGKTERVA